MASVRDHLLKTRQPARALSMNQLE